MLETAYSKSLWNTLSKTNTHTSIKDLLISKLNLNNDSVILPDLNKVNELTENCFVLLTSFGLKEVLIKTLNLNPDNIYEVNGNIKSDGSVSEELTEPEINKALRFTFNKKPKKVVVALLNSIHNPIHEQILINLLKTAGYNNSSSILKLN
jgi:hypothetical protein